MVAGMYEYHTVPTDQFILTIHSTKGECLYQSGRRSSCMYEYHTVPTDQFILTIHSTKGECLYQSGTVGAYIALPLSVLGIRIRRICMFWGLLDPYP
jgi:hypothetical protein